MHKHTEGRTDRQTDRPANRNIDKHGGGGGGLKPRWHDTGQTRAKRILQFCDFDDVVYNNDVVIAAAAAVSCTNDNNIAQFTQMISELEELLDSNQATISERASELQKGAQ